MSSEDKPMHGEIQIERMWTAKKKQKETDYQRARTKKKTHKRNESKQALLAGGHTEAKAIGHSGGSFGGGVSIPKVSIDHQGFAGDNHPHGW